jgi:hypothetical protein
VPGFVDALNKVIAKQATRFVIASPENAVAVEKALEMTPFLIKRPTVLDIARVEKTALH